MTSTNRGGDEDADDKCLTSTDWGGDDGADDKCLTSTDWGGDDDDDNDARCSKSHSATFSIEREWNYTQNSSVSDGL